MDVASLQYEAEVAARFDLLERRFKPALGHGDVRLEALRDCLGPLPGQRVLDLGCGKGRFAAALAREGAAVAVIDGPGFAHALVGARIRTDSPTLL